MAVTSLSCSVNSNEYSRIEPDKSIITVTISAVGTSLSAESVTVSLIKARYARDVEIAYVTVPLTGTTSCTVTTTFNLPNILEATLLYPKARRGSYFVQARSVSTPGTFGNSPDFLISLISVDRLRKDFLFGVPATALDVLSVHAQPVVITGVTFSGVAQAHPTGWFPLAYNYNTDGSTIVRTLSWCGGPEVVLSPAQTKYTLRLGASAAYVDVLVDFNALPTLSISEELLIERSFLSDAVLRQKLEEAISWVEKVALSIYLEPTRISTEIDSTNFFFPVGSDIPTLPLWDVDERVDTVSYFKPEPGHWLWIKYPYYPLIKLESLYGKVSNLRVMDVPVEWIEIHEKGGWVELVPFSNVAGLTYQGLLWASTAWSGATIPGFWNSVAIVGFRNLPATLIELVAKKAVLDMLILASQAYRGGIASSSLGRDGVSESLSYGQGLYGPYSGPINLYKQLIDQDLKMYRGVFSGPRMQVF